MKSEKEDLICSVGLLALIGLVVLFAYFFSMGQSSTWLEENGNVVVVVEEEHSLNEPRTFVIKSVKTDATYKAKANQQTVLVGEKWIIEDRSVEGGWSHPGFFQFKEKVE